MPTPVLSREQAIELLMDQEQPSTQTMTSKAAIKRLFTSEKIQADWFTPTFLEQVPIAQLEQVITQFKTSLGSYQQVQEAGEDYLVFFERGSVPAKIFLNNNGQITGLALQSPRTKITSLDEAIDQFKALPGQVSFLVVEDNSQRAALNATTPLAVGSAFKLAVLNALQAQIASDQRSLSDVVELQPSWKSLPTGILQDWPEGSRLTLETVASLMISQSDNTATDSLINVVGREAIEAIAPRNRPFLTTREFFLLKSDSNQELLQRYRRGNEAQRRAILKELEQLPPPDINALASTPKALDVEWFFTTQELCNLIQTVADLPLMSINSGVAVPSTQDWERIAFKGGSEPGVLNLTTWLKAKNGKSYCVAATWNHDKPLDKATFTSLYSGVIDSLK